jgi:hypothetical protein
MLNKGRILIGVVQKQTGGGSVSCFLFVEFFSGVNFHQLKHFLLALLL